MAVTVTGMARHAMIIWAAGHGDARAGPITVREEPGLASLSDYFGTSTSRIGWPD
jgi:hypothetical protein